MPAAGKQLKEKQRVLLFKDEFLCLTEEDLGRGRLGDKGKKNKPELSPRSPAPKFIHGVVP